MANRLGYYYRLPKKKQFDKHCNIKHKYLQDQLNEVKERLNQLSDSSVNDLIIKNNLNNSQSTLVREILTASKYKNHINRRYSENWMLLCLLFNIRSPGAYRYLQEQDIIPLPCTSTIRKHYLWSKLIVDLISSFLSYSKEGCLINLWNNDMEFSCLTKFS